MRTEGNERESTHVTLGLDDGDWVIVVLKDLMVIFGFFARVVEADDRFLRVVVHSDVSTHWEAQPASECMALEMVVPWSAISWVVHAKVKPFDCKCLEA